MTNRYKKFKNEVMKSFIEERIYGEMTIEEIDLNEIKNEIIKKMIRLSKSLSYEKPVAFFALFFYLLDAGFLHYKKEPLCKKETPFSEPLSITGAVSLNHHGVCRNKGMLLAESLKQVGYEASIQTGRLLVKKGKQSFLSASQCKKYLMPEENVTLQTLNELLFFSTKTEFHYKQDTLDNYLYGNHIITLVKGNGKMYYFDPQKGWCWDYASIFHLKGPYKMTFARRDHNLTRIYNQLLDGESYSFKKGSSLTETNREFRQYCLLLEEYKETLDAFYQDIKGSLETAESLYQKIRK